MIEGYKVLVRDKQKKEIQSYGITYNRYDLASVTKIIVGIRILQLIDEGILKLKSKVSDYMDNFQDNKITIEDCLLHRTGFNPSAKNRYRLKGDALIDDILGGTDLDKDKYGETCYSCINFVLLGLVIEKIDGSLEASLDDYIFKPLGMNQTDFNPKNDKDIAPTEIHLERGLIKGVVHDSTAFSLGGVAGNAGLFSSISDLEKLFDSLVEDEKILTNKMKNKIQETNVGGRSLAFNLSEENELYHTGFTGPLVMINFSEVKYMILLTNRTYPDRGNHEYLLKREQLIKDFSKGVVDTKILFDMIYP